MASSVSESVSKAVNNLHLVCRNLHQIANLHVNPNLSIDEKSPEKHLESLVQSSRIFEELKFSHDSNEYLSSPEKFQVLEEFISFIEPHIKKLIIDHLKVDQMTLFFVIKKNIYYYFRLQTGNPFLM